MLVDGALGDKVRFHWRGAGSVIEPVLSLFVSLPVYLSAEEPIPKEIQISRSVGWRSSIPAVAEVELVWKQRLPSGGFSNQD